LYFDNEGYTICNKCNGTGQDKDGIFICDKCEGLGKIDWISRAVSFSKESIPTKRIDIRKVVSNIQNVVDNVLSKEVCDKISSYCSLLKNHNVIYDYKIDYNKETNLEVFLKPSKTLEIVHISFEIK